VSKRRRPFVAVETDVVKDESFAVLGDVCGYNRDEALGRIVRLWAWCADRKLQDAPAGCPGYAVSEGVIVRFLGPDGVRGILGDGVAEFALGERWGDLIYLRGTDATVAAIGADPIDTVDRLVTYAIEAAGLSVVKIGRTGDVSRRLVALQTGHHAELLLFGVVEGDREESLHAHLDALGKRVRGEWFRFDAETVELLAAHGITRSS
jgi:hypothetical protein